MRTRHYVDLPSTVVQISLKDAKLAAQAGDLVEVQRWDTRDWQTHNPHTIVVYRTPDRVTVTSRGNNG